MTQTIALHNVTVRHGGAPILGPITANLPCHGITAIMGPNGAGKSTLLRAIHGLDQIIAGKVDTPAPVTEQAFVFQTPRLLRRSVEANLTYPLRIRGVPKQMAAGQAHEIAQTLGLGDKLKQSAITLSGGEAQKLTLGRALIGGARLLLVDEPCANLDPAASHQVEEILRNAASSGVAVLITTHDQSQAKRLADTVVMLHKGQIVEQGTASTFFGAPQSPEAQAYLNGDLLL